MTLEDLLWAATIASAGLVLSGGLLLFAGKGGGLVLFLPGIAFLGPRVIFAVQAWWRRRR